MRQQSTQTFDSHRRAPSATLTLLGGALLMAACGSRPGPLTASTLPLVAQVVAEPPTAPTTFDVAAIDSFVGETVQRRGVVGLALTLIRDGKVVLARSYGKRSLSDGSAVEVDTPFAIGSLTKQFTCAAVLLLAEEGKLSLSDRVAKYYPELTRASDITIHDLLTHVSGYPDYYPLDFIDRRMQHPIEPDALLRQYAGRPLDFEPGTRWSYSNTGYILAGRIVEKVSGEAFGRFLSARIFKPLGMEHSSFEPPPQSPGLAQGHSAFALGEPEVVATEAAGWLHAAGGMYASAPDLGRWDLALAEGKLLKPQSFQQMTMPRLLVDGKSTDYGCGLGVGRRSGETVLRHTGAINGFHAYNVLVPRTHSALVVLVNDDKFDAAPLSETLLSLLVKEDGQLPKVAGPPVRDAALAMLHQLQAGSIDRSQLGEEFALVVSDEQVRRAAPRLKALGEPTSIDVESIAERGGMEQSSLRLNFKSGAVRVSLFRSVDGKVQQYLLGRI
jgi:CubicO group peptidase (beta-lactamase class C family)